MKYSVNDCYFSCDSCCSDIAVKDKFYEGGGYDQDGEYSFILCAQCALELFGIGDDHAINL